MYENSGIIAYIDLLTAKERSCPTHSVVAVYMSYFGYQLVVK